MAGRILISSAYLPPVEYFSLISEAGEILIEREENFLKQSYRNRCYILSAHGPQLLTVPVYEGSRHKTLIKDIRIDYSKRWQQIHLRALSASYGSSPYFQFYFEDIELIVSKNHSFLLDLNIELTVLICSLIKSGKKLSCTTVFEPVGNSVNDFRYSLSPKNRSVFRPKEYIKVFNSGEGIDPRISIVDLIFNTGPEAAAYL
jgi:hypothetical protein